MLQEKETLKLKTIYLWGLVGLIPNLGAFVGLILILLGLFKHRDKILVLIGSICILWTLALDSYFYFKLIENPNFFGDGKENITKYEINELVKEIELFNVSRGRYPYTLQELDSISKINGNHLMIMDPYQIGINNNNNSGLFNYKFLDDKYLIFSVGEDKIAYTDDDIYPDLSEENKGKIGYLPKKSKVNP